MSRLSSVAPVLLVGSILIPFWACEGGVAPPTTGTLEVRVAGFPPGLFELSILVGAERRRFNGYDPRPLLTIRDVEPGDYTLTLVDLPSGVPADCSAPSEQTVTVAAGVTRRVQFDVSCTWGLLEITTTTTGVGQGPDGYDLRTTGLCYGYYYEYECLETIHHSVPANGTVIRTITSVMNPTAFKAILVGGAANCVTPDTVYFSYPAQSAIALTVDCAAGAPSRAPRP